MSIHFKKEGVQQGSRFLGHPFWVYIVETEKMRFGALNFLQCGMEAVVEWADRHINLTQGARLRAPLVGVDLPEDQEPNKEDIVPVPHSACRGLSGPSAHQRVLECLFEG